MQTRTFCALCCYAAYLYSEWPETRTVS